MVETKQPHPSLSKETALPLPLVTVTVPESTKQQNGIIWGSALDYHELPHKPSHYSNSSDSPCMSESGSDILNKREVIDKLRQQLKRRDEMILEMQAQITDLQSSSNAQLMHSTQMQSQVESVNHNLFEAERDIQRLRRAIADQCMGEMGSPEKPMMGKNGLIEPRNGHVNGLIHNSWNTSVDKACARGQVGKRFEMLKREVEELKAVPIYAFGRRVPIPHAFSYEIKYALSYAWVHVWWGEMPEREGAFNFSSLKDPTSWFAVDHVIRGMVVATGRPKPSHSHPLIGWMSPRRLALICPIV
ncbi:hypothetical protein ACLOJK_019481 [Asimina triloba]